MPSRRELPAPAARVGAGAARASGPSRRGLHPGGKARGPTSPGPPGRRQDQVRAAVQGDRHQQEERDRHQADDLDGGTPGAAGGVDEQRRDGRATEEAAEVSCQEMPLTLTVSRKLMPIQIRMPWGLARIFSATTSSPPIRPKIAPDAPTVAPYSGPAQ